MSVLVRGKPLQVERGSLGSPKARLSFVGGAGEGAGILGDLHAGVCTPMLVRTEGVRDFLMSGKERYTGGFLVPQVDCAGGDVAHG